MDVNHHKVLSLLRIPNVDVKEEQEEFFGNLLTELRFILMAVSCKYPKRDISMEEYNERDKALKLKLIRDFAWIRWPDYLHIG